MRGPQLEDGYTRIANETLETIAKFPINATQLRIIMVLWRYTYGFNRKSSELSQSFIAETTGIHKKQVQRELNALIKMNIVVVEKEADFSSPRVLRFNKYYQSWEGANKLPPNEKDTHTGSELVTSPGSGLVTQERQYKDNLKERVVEGVPSPESNPDKVPSHCQENDPVLVFLNQVSSYYTTLTNRLPGSNDHIAISNISNLTVDFELVKQAMDESKKNFKPNYDGDEIRSFKYFVPAIKTRIAAEQIRKEGGKANGPAPSNAAEYFKKNKNKFLYKAE